MTPEQPPDRGVTWSMCSQNKLISQGPKDFACQTLVSIQAATTLEHTRRSLSRPMIESDLKVDLFHLDRVDLNGPRVQTAGPSVWVQIWSFLDCCAVWTYTVSRFSGKLRDSKDCDESCFLLVHVTFRNADPVSSARLGYLKPVA
jgi:hypothetical protein